MCIKRDDVDENPRRPQVNRLMVLILQKKEGEKEEQKDLKRIHFVYQVRKKYRFFTFRFW